MIPEELKKLNQWVCVGANKVPMQATIPFPASSSNPSTWSDYETAKAAVDKGLYDNLGFVFNDNGYIGIDIDDGYDCGKITDLASDIILACESYTERSRSGRGFHIILKGKLPFKGKNNLKGVEIYQEARYFIMTGDTVMFTQIKENQEAIDKILAKYFPASEKTSKSTFSAKIYRPKWSKNEEKIKLRPTYPPIQNGSRNLCLTSLAGSLHSTGYTPRQIYNELVICNKRACNPCVSENELMTIVTSVTRYRRK